MAVKTFRCSQINLTNDGRDIYGEKQQNFIEGDEERVFYHIYGYKVSII